MPEQLLFANIFLGALLSLGVVTALTCLLLYHKHPSIFIRAGVMVLGLSALICTILLSYASFIAPFSVRVNEQFLYTEKVSNIKIALVSDLHVRPGKGVQFLETVVQKINALEPDIVLLVGDYVYDWESDPSALSALTQLQSPLGTFAVLGNHDQGGYESLNGTRIQMDTELDSLIETLQSANITLLRNSSVLLPAPFQTIRLSGIDDWWAEPDLSAAFAGSSDLELKILLSHNPSVIQSTEASPADIVLSGHTHGGQVRLPFFGPLKQLPTSLGDSYDRGTFTVSPTQNLVITQGIGESLLPIRFLAPPEILFLHLQHD